MTPDDNLLELERLARSHGVDVISSAKIAPRYREQFHPSIRGISEALGYAAVIGMRLSRPVLDTVTVAPTWTYYHHYRMVNIALDQAALLVAGGCRRRGYRAFPVPASQILDWDRLRGHLSHRSMGELAGLGWRGRNNLLVHPRYGSMVRYTTVLTDMPLPEGGAPEELRLGGVRGRTLQPQFAGEARSVHTSESFGCGSCRACIGACPVDAIHDSADEFDLDRCTAQLRRFAREEKLNTLICGLCVRVCRGQRAKEPE